jgi:hypothetical protein
VDIVFISGSAHTESISTLLQETPQILNPLYLRSSLDNAEQNFDSKFEVERERNREREEGSRRVRKGGERGKEGR